MSLQIVELHVYLFEWLIDNVNAQESYDIEPFLFDIRLHVASKKSHLLIL